MVTLIVVVCVETVADQFFIFLRTVIMIILRWTREVMIHLMMVIFVVSLRTIVLIIARLHIEK